YRDGSWDSLLDGSGRPRAGRMEIASRACDGPMGDDPTHSGRGLQAAVNANLPKSDPSSNEPSCVTPSTPGLDSRPLRPHHHLVMGRELLRGSGRVMVAVLLVAGSARARAGVI